MFVRIDNSSGVPITRQITDQIAAQCATGALAPGDRLPSVRELAQELAVNQNTILRVYERLTVQGLLVRKHGDGTFVADDLPRRQMHQQRAMLRQEIRRLWERARTLSVTAEELHELLDEVAAGQAGEAEEAVPVRWNSRQKGNTP